MTKGSGRLYFTDKPACSAGSWKDSVESISLVTNDNQEIEEKTLRLLKEYG